MLELSAQYSPRFDRFLDEIQKGKPSQKAIEGVYGKPLEAVEKDLQVYFRNNTFSGRIFSLKLQSGEKIAPEPASMFDVKLALLDLANRPGKEAETRGRLSDLMSEDPKRAEPYVALGYLAGRSGQQEEALKSFENAVELGSRNPQMLWDYGRMAGASNPLQAMRALNTLLADQPARVDVRLVVAQIQISNKQAKEAIETLSVLKKVTPAEAPKFFRILAFANMEVGNRQEARVSAQRWLEYTQDTDEKVNANRLLRYLDDREAVAARPAAAPARPPVPAPNLAREDTESRPTLVRPIAPTAEVPQPAPAIPQMPSIAGNLAELDCKGPLPKFVLQTDNGRVSLLMDDPVKILITGLQEGAVDMNCGPQKQVAVWIEYEPPPAGQPGVKGIVRAIHYEPPAGKLRQR
jgi:Tfp pilus assembly protein PilF